MMRVVHLLDDFAMGGVTKGLSVFAEPELAAMATHRVLPVQGRPLLAPTLEADVIVTHMPPAWNRAAFFRTIKLRNPNARWVHVEHSYTEAWERRYVTSRARFRAMLRLVLSGADEVVGVSRAQGEWLSRACGVHVNTVRPWSGRTDLLQVAPVIQEAGQPVRLAAYGRFSEQKNFPALVAAVASLPAGLVELHIGGEGPDEAAMRHAAGTLANIRFHGRIDDVGEFLAPMHGVVVPSVYEAFGQVALEARLAARPILVADVDGLREQVGNAGIAADCTTPRAIAEAIRRFAALPLSELGKIGRREAMSHRDEVVAGWRAVLAPTRHTNRRKQTVSARAPRQTDPMIVPVS